MAYESYNVIFNGQISGMYPIDQVKKNLAELFKLGNQKVESLFTGKEVKIKKSIDYITAQKFNKAFEQAGAICVLEKTGCKNSNNLVLELDSEKTVPLQDESKMVCPKCGHEQPESPNCSKCGIVIRKYNGKDHISIEAETPEYPPIKINNTKKESGGFFAWEKIGLQKGIIGGIIMMAIAVIWFTVGYAAGYIFFYPPILFIIGFIGFLKGLFTGNING